MLESQIANIAPKQIKLKRRQAVKEIPNDAVIVCAGGELPTPFLKRIGVMVDTRRGS